MEQSDYNNLHEIEDLRHEIVQDKKDVKHDHLFKIIIIGSTGKSIPLGHKFNPIYRYWKKLHVEALGR